MRSPPPGARTRGAAHPAAGALLAAWRRHVRRVQSGGGGKIRWQAATFQFGPHESAESWRALGAMELIKPETKSELGGLALDLLAREKVSAMRDALLFAIGRLGARVPVYGPLNTLVPAEAAGAWARRLL